MCEQENSRHEICGRVKRSEPEYQSSDVTTSEAEGTTAAKTANFKTRNLRDPFISIYKNLIILEAKSSIPIITLIIADNKTMPADISFAISTNLE